MPATQKALAAKDSLFTTVEQKVRDFKVGSGTRPFNWEGKIQGLMSEKVVAKELGILKNLSVDDYIARVLEPAESNTMVSARNVVRMINGKTYNEIDMGPLYAVEITVDIAQGSRRIGVIAQNRTVANGVWKPEHHLEAARLVRIFNRRNIPIITFMDTPGADASAEANENNQAHAISRLIAEMTNTHVPTIGIVYGLGYSGGAIPLASTNLLLSVRTGVFNTIQPKGLASIARQYNLSWQESARYVGISPAELNSRGVLDGIIDWAPADSSIGIEPLVNAILSGISAIENICVEMVGAQGAISEDYLSQVQRFLHPDENFTKLQKVADFHVEDFPTEYPNIFAHACRHQRYLTMRTRIMSSTTDAYGRLSKEEIPKGDLSDRTQKAREDGFERWNNDPEKLIYQDDLFRAWKSYKEKRNELSAERGRFTTLLLGDPQKNFEDARQKLCFRTTLYLYNRWKADCEYNFVKLSQLVKDAEGGNSKIYDKPETDLTISEIIFNADLKAHFLSQFENILIFDALYNSIVNNFGDIAAETREFHTLSAESLKRILDTSIESATTHVASMDNAASAEIKSGQFARWLNSFVSYRRRGDFLKEVEEWKRVIFPRLSDALLVLITFFFEELVPEYLNSQIQGKTYQGEINPVRIGKRKDFWNQLNIAYRDLLVQKILDTLKRKKVTTAQAFKDKFFSNFEETNADLMTANPVSFPGFRISIEKALNNKVTPCGVITGVGNLNIEGAPRVATVISNVSFQAGAFDMASAEKMCNLMVTCAQQNLPLVCFVSSGGMQTKEGANALFSMAIVNDRITRFVCETGLPVIVFGFGDCTGGSQASFVTHPLVQTYYLSGTDLPFAGRVVVPSFLPSMCTVSNYLVKNEGAMHGIVKHPFAEDLDDQLRKIDPEIAIPKESIEDVLEKTLAGRVDTQSAIEIAEPAQARDLMRPIETILIHARGCTAAKLIRVAKKLGKRVILVQSDPDMDSAPASMLDGNDELVCLGGQTPDESYLNAHSVLAIAARQGADSLHPGIGFLSENAGFARLCRARGLNFLGPRAQSMDQMGNKSTAIHTAMANDVPVVPGSHGILATASVAAKVADEIGYPVLLKAVHGGGGKGIQVVREPSEIKTAFNRVFAEAKSAFGNGDLYLEKFVESMRHIEIQILRDGHGNTQILGLRDCTVQRNNQKVLEESGSTMLTAALAKKAYASARKLADAVDYIGAGTVEFIYDLKNKTIYFMEMNTRLQVEHPVTEWTSGIQIVEQQFNIAEGGSIADIKIEDNGFAIEARITAEKAKLNDEGEFDFIPTPGLVTECRFPERKDLEIISAVDEGKTISPFYDSMIAQLIVHGKDRNDAIAKLLEVLGDVSIKGVCTNIPLLKRILVDPVFVKGKYDTGYLPAFLKSLDSDDLVIEMAYTGVETATTSLDSLRIEGTDELKVLAPMTGIYYSTPSPNDPEYVEIGSQINLSTTLCQIEAMKLFSQISLSSVTGAGELFQADQNYEVVRLNQANGAQINAGDLLFVVRPS
jgi:acetyl/propionyl-CoA carboxylase alpha subunit/acetyl-CoA carboxylase beta subunit